MKTKTNVTVYQCEFCNKKLFRKSAMELHENKCTHRPLNIRACFNCPLVDKVKIKYEPSYNFYGADNMITSFTFKCTAKEIFMYPPRIEHSVNGVPGFVECNGEEITQEAMPIECDLKPEMEDDFMNFANRLK